MNDKDITQTTKNDMAKLMLIFDRRDSPTKDQIYAYGWGIGYSDYQIDRTMECLLDYGYIHEPIKDHFKMLRRIG